MVFLGPLDCQDKRELQDHLAGMALQVSQESREIWVIVECLDFLANLVLKVPREREAHLVRLDLQEAKDPRAFLVERALLALREIQVFLESEECQVRLE